VLSLGADTAESGSLPTDVPADPVGRGAAARLVAATVARACWPQYLLPRASSTAIGFSYAARRATPVLLAGTTDPGLATWLAACGFDVRGSAAEGWRPPEGPAIVYRPGGWRAAAAAAGDLGWPRATLVADKSVPAALAVVLAPK
jgi:hypothetical protein